VLDAHAVTAAVPGHDAVISALGHSRPSPAGHDLHPGASHIIEAMKAARVSRLIWISSHGVGDSRGHSASNSPGQNPRGLRPGSHAFLTTEHLLGSEVSGERHHQRSTHPCDRASSVK
jgi:nucleoside-diphosphate-sugar epimerase